MTRRTTIAAFIVSLALPLSALAVTTGTSVANGRTTHPAVAAKRSHSAASVTRSRIRPTVQVRRTALGQILVDAGGRSLYLFEKDSRGESRCSGSCASNWPPLLVTRRPVAGRGIRTSKVGTTKRSDGKTQVVYNGHPLYRFIADTRPGNTNGQGLTAFGARWFVVSPSGNAIR